MPLKLQEYHSRIHTIQAKSLENQYSSNAHSIVTKTRTPNRYTVATDPKVDMNSLGRSASAPGHLRRNTPADLLSAPIRTHSSKSTNVRPPKRPSALNVTESHRNSLIDTEMPQTPVTSALYDVFDSPSPDLDLGKTVSTKEEEEGDDSHVIVLE